MQTFMRITIAALALSACAKIEEKVEEKNTVPPSVNELFQREVPEIREGVVTIEAIAREPGVLTKIAVRSIDYEVDPVEACVGVGGARIRVLVEALGGERIDVVPFDKDAVRFVCNALAPAEIARVILDEEEHAMELVIPDKGLTKANGTNGVNLRLAAQLTGWRLELISESKFKKARDSAN